MSFPETSWSLVLATREPAPEAISKLCELYWYPVYAFIRARGKSPDDARDLAQEFFLRVIEKRSFETADRERGRFRWFLQASVKHFLANEHERANAQKRGGGKTILSLDADGAEQQYRLEAVDTMTPEKAFDRRWGLLLLRRAMERIEAEQKSAGKGDVFEHLKPHLVGDNDAGGYRDLAAAMGLSESGARVAAHRLRRRFAEVLRAEIADTLESSGDVDAELRFLMNALR